MDLKTLKATVKGKFKNRKRRGIGPASGIGGTSGRGHKGQKARSGWSMRRPFEGGQMPLFRQLPKRGFNNAEFTTRFKVLNVDQLKDIPSGETVDLARLREAGLINRSTRRVKILGNGELNAALTVRVQKFSRSAVEKIEKAGGKAEVVETAR